MNKSHIARIFTTIIALTFGNMAFSAGIPVINPSVPIKISEILTYTCNNGKAMQLLDSGRKEYLVYENKTVACHDDNLWLDGKALSFMDLVYLSTSEVKKIQMR